MLLSLSLLFLLACVFGFKQSRDLKKAQDSLNKQSLELDIIRSLYLHNLKLLSESTYTEEDKWIEENLRALNTSTRL